MKKFIIPVALATAVFSIAPYHTVAVPVAPDQLINPQGIVEPPPAEPPIFYLPPIPLPEEPPPAIPPIPYAIPIPPPPPAPSVIVIPPPPTEPPAIPTDLLVSPPPATVAPPPPAPVTPLQGVPETGGTWLLLGLGLIATFVGLSVQERSKKRSGRNS